MKRLIFYCILILIPIFYGCYRDKLDEIYPLSAYRDPCDSTLDTVYAQSIKLIVTYNCVTCHNNSNASGGVSLDSYEATKEQVDNNALYGSVHRQSNYTPMPPSGNLQDCEIKRLDAWIKKGAPQ